jgi:hypothetical protein
MPVEGDRKAGVQIMVIRNKKLGADHPDTLTSMANHAFTWKGGSGDEEAIRLMDECVSLHMRVLGASHYLNTRRLKYQVDREQKIWPFRKKLYNSRSAMVMGMYQRGPMSWWLWAFRFDYHHAP